MKKAEFDKLLIAKSKQGRSDGAYSRLLGDEESLISQIHIMQIPMNFNAILMRF